VDGGLGAGVADADVDRLLRDVQRGTDAEGGQRRLHLPRRRWPWELGSGEC
jgi:hypothetical protein